MSKEVLITIITVCYNAENIIEKTMNSIMDQNNNNNIEYIIIDGSSVDNTVDIIKKNETKYGFKFLSEKDTGIYDAMNKGIKMATGDYIFFLNSGDRFVDNYVIDDVINEIKNNKPDILYGNILEEKNNITMGKLTYNKFKVDKQSFCRGNMICHQTIFIKTEILKKYNFNIKYKICADKDLIITLYKHKFKFRYFDRSISIYDRSGISSTNITKLKSETEKILLDHFPIYARIFILLKKVKRLMYKLRED